MADRPTLPEAIDGAQSCTHERGAPIELFLDAQTVEPTGPPTPEHPEVARTLWDLLDPGEPKRLFAVIDGSIGLPLAMQLRRLGTRLYTLFEGSSARDAAPAGPLVAPLTAHLETALALWTDQLGRNQGLLLQTYAELRPLLAHLREIFVASDEEGTEYFFRFYDPRVLPTYLETCTPEERASFFGPITALICERTGASGSDDGAATRSAYQRFGRSARSAPALPSLL